MLDTISLLVTLCIVAAILGYVAQFLALWKIMHNGATEPLSDAECPPAVVILALRGGDPFLCRSLRALTVQDYPDYQVRIVVDSVHDASGTFIRDAFGDELPFHVDLQVLTKRLGTCTGKCSSILQATESLPARCEIVAMMDGDVVPHPNWLRTLAAPIVRRGVDVCTGQRWYSPDYATLMSMSRFWWGAMVFPLMAMFKQPWGGTIAYRRAMFDNGKFREWLSYASSDDIATGQFLANHGLRSHFEPSLTMVNRENTDLRGYFSFVVRQMMFVRLESRQYWKMLLAGSAATLIPLYPAVRLIRIGWSAWTDTAVALFTVAVVTYLTSVALTVRWTVARRGECLPPWDLRRAFLSFGAMALMSILHLTAAVQSGFQRRLYWRGVWYRVTLPSRALVEMDEWAVARGEVAVGPIPPPSDACMDAQKLRRAG